MKFKLMSWFFAKQILINHSCCDHNVVQIWMEKFFKFYKTIQVYSYVYILCVVLILLNSEVENNMVHRTYTYSILLRYRLKKQKKTVQCQVIFNGAQYLVVFGI